jgi:putative ABC transport system permease protein
MSKGFILLTVIAIFIACLGLVGLAAYNTSQRTREIGVRKVMGANTFSLLRMLWWNFIRLIGISTLIAWPIAYILAKDWLNNFAYRIDISPWVFIISAAMGVVLALASVATITYSAVRQNPAKSLKWE